MIVGFSHKALKRFYETGDRSRLQADMVERISVLLAALDEAEDIKDMDRPSFRLHSLKGDRKGEWAVTVRANWRLTFRFADGEVDDVDLVDYH